MSRMAFGKSSIGIAFIGIAFIIAVTLLNMVSKPYLDPLPLYSIHNWSNSRSDVFDITGDLRIQGSSSTIFITSTASFVDKYRELKPYARKQDSLAMGRVTTLKLTSSTPPTPGCDRISTPAVVFSTGGYAGNHFHAFTDVLLPLYLTSHRFNRSVLFLVFDKYPGWISKYKLILDELSRYDAVEMDGDERVLCLPRAIVGLKANKEFTIDDEYDHSSVVMTDFTKLLRSAYALRRGDVSVTTGRRRRPRMLVVCRRRGGRHLVNKHEMADMARGLGFDVVLKKMVWNVSDVARLVNSFDAMVGVHGAGLTNMVFLPENAVVIQIVPFGLDFIAKTCFQVPAQSMKLRYLEYKASLNESSLLLAKHSKINYTDPAAMTKFDDFKSVYLDNQDLNIELGRFRTTLLKALELLRDA